MVIRRVIQRYAVQQLVKRAKPGITQYFAREYGQFIGGAAGVALSVSVGDYYGALTGITGNFGNNPPDRRNPPFGYLEGNEINGQTNYSFHQTLRPTRFTKYNRRSRRKPCYCGSGKYGKQYRQRRGSRRRFY